MSVRVVETFGPTVQGEGPYAGRVCHFLRVGGCDFRCSWCDSPHAVLPELVRANATRMSAAEVMDSLDALPSAPMLVISGGNPVLAHLEPFIPLAGERYDLLAIETQGSRWKDWLNDIDSLVVSPKPPSSGEATTHNRIQFDMFMGKAHGHRGLVLKIVVFDDADLAWAGVIHRAYPNVPLYLSAGTDQDEAGHADTVESVASRYAWLCEAVTEELDLHNTIVLPQLHVIAWGHKVGV